MVVKRRAFQIDPVLLKKLKRMQGEIKAQTGEEPSLTELSKEISHARSFENVWKETIDNYDKEKLKLKIKYDRNLR